MTYLDPKQSCERMLSLCALAPVVPVVVIDDHEKAKDLGQALVSGGLPVLEITLRTPAALKSIRLMSEIQGGVVGAGTVITEDDVLRAIDAGAQFAVSPGATDSLIEACAKNGLPLLAGSSTASEAMKLLERGYTIQKFFPAEASGGAKFIKSLASPLPQITFCPTGGVSLENAADYLSSANVATVGGSWVAPKDLITNNKWDRIVEIAQNAVDLLGKK